MTLKKLILLPFILAILLNCTSPAENPQEKEWRAINQYQELMNAFENTRTWDDYPDYYCGAYINDQKDFVVLVKEGTDEAEISRLINDSDVIIKTADYSYNELKNLYDELNTKIDFLEKNDPEMVSLIHDITTFGIYDDENRIIVTILDVNDQKIKQFKEKVSDSDAIVFDGGIYPVIPSASEWTNTEF